MAATSNNIISASTLDAVTPALILTDETRITGYSTPLTGEIVGYRILLQVSPDNGVTWTDDDDHVLICNGFVTLSVCATQVRAKVVGAVRNETTVTIDILAR